MKTETGLSLLLGSQLPGVRYDTKRRTIQGALAGLSVEDLEAAGSIWDLVERAAGRTLFSDRFDSGTVPSDNRDFLESLPVPATRRDDLLSVMPGLAAPLLDSAHWRLGSMFSRRIRRLAGTFEGPSAERRRSLASEISALISNKAGISSLKVSGYKADMNVEIREVPDNEPDHHPIEFIYRVMVWTEQRVNLNMESSEFVGFSCDVYSEIDLGDPDAQTIEDLRTFCG